MRVRRKRARANRQIDGLCRRVARETLSPQRLDDLVASVQLLLAARKLRGEQLGHLRRHVPRLRKGHAALSGRATLIPKTATFPKPCFKVFESVGLEHRHRHADLFPEENSVLEVSQTHFHIHTEVCDGRSAASLRHSSESLHGTGGCASCVNGRPASPRPPAPRHSTRGGSGSRTASFRRGQGAGCFRCQRTVRILGVALHLRAHGIRRTLSCGNLSLGEGARRSDRKDCQRRARCCKMRDDTH